MKLIRQHAGVIAAIAVLWQVSAIAAASTALSCSGAAAPRRTAAAAHENMADCPMRKSEPSCPLHADKHGGHDCDCPTLECSETDSAFLALFGTVGILPSKSAFDGLSPTGDAGSVITPMAIRLAGVPLSPPPRI